ncbi:tRNA 2 -phosphotransferase 1 [Hyphodiscus hymeniophilus]|uniref:2'-phosphotransferase n=1 Tax=Hyphodiscus hymeniophilus TaxID=353542 RepID=A0A9P6VRB1_9HELO|nr:tRNA 2 -phosphotransferase 1 [Hyphodiscus hymeniophilus]
MLKRLPAFLTLSRIISPPVLSVPSTKRLSKTNTKYMADHDSAEPSDLVNLSQEQEIEDRGARHSNRGGKSRGRGLGGRGGKGGGGGRGGGGREINREVAVSKALSKLLRHAAADAGLALDREGFARVDQVVSSSCRALDAVLLRKRKRWRVYMMKWPRLRSLKITFEDIKTTVSDNAKQRFSMKPNPALTSIPDLASEEPSDWVIRANQGHSIAIESAALLAPITLEAGNVPEVVIHGTYFAFYQPILETGGLKKMSRNHIHFSTGLPEDKQGVISGMRNDAEILVYVDIEKSLQDGGMLWWVSENGVVLTEGDEHGILPTKYWKKVVGRKEDVGKLWEDGVELADLPQRLRNKKPPNGKGHRVRGEPQNQEESPRNPEERT